MKRVLTGLLLCVVLVVMARPAAAQPNTAEKPLRIGTVDLSRVFTNYWKFKQANAQLEDEKAELAKTDSELLASHQKAFEEYNKLREDANNQALSSDEREKRRGAAEDKSKEVKDIENNIKKFRQSSQTRIVEQTMRMRDNLLTEIKAAVSSKAKAGDFTLVLDSAALSADRTHVILYGSAIDLTDSVLSQLNAAAPSAK
jgi:outer membrane protein